MNAEKMTKEQVELALKVGAEAQRMGINPDFVLPLVAAESGFNPNAVSKKGAIGLMQLMPDTAKSLGVDPYDVDQNIQGGLQFIKQLSTMKNIGTNPVALLSAYNAGPGSKFLESGDPDQIPAETAAFVKRIEKYSGGQLRNPFIGVEGESEGAAQPGASQPGAGDGTTTTGNGSTTPASELDFQRLMLDLGGAAAGATLSGGMQLSGAAMNRIGNVYDALTSRGPQQQGMTSGEKWMQNWAGANTPGVGGVPEASAKYQRMKDHGKVSGRATKMFGPRLPGEPASIVDRLMARGQQAEEMARRQRSPMNLARGALTSPVGRLGIGALGGYSAVNQAQQAAEKFAEQNYPMAAAHGAGALGGLMMTVPSGPVQVAGGALSLAPEAMRLYNMAKERSEGKPTGTPSIYESYFAP